MTVLDETRRLEAPPHAEKDNSLIILFGNIL